eukprot:jgi/Tetstr1/456405/TSEL_043139.t1
MSGNSSQPGVDFSVHIRDSETNIPSISTDCILPPTLGAGAEEVFGSRDKRRSIAEVPAGQAIGEVDSRSLRRGRSEKDLGTTQQLDREYELRHGLELVMLLPWPLKSRAMYYPPINSIKSLTPSWDAAPPSEGVTIMFMFLEGAAELKRLAKDAAAEALWRLQSVVRNQLVLHNGYEVEVEKGNFVCAFRDACDSIKFATAVNILLMDMSWGSEVLAQPWGCEQRNAANEVIFRGLRLSIGMCTGDAMRVQPCMRTGKMEYYGPIMNHAARVAVAAHAGQVLLHESAWGALRSGACIGEDQVLFRNMGRHKLKGIGRKVLIIQAIPTALSARAFPPIKTKSSSHPGKAAPMTSLAELDDYLANVGGVEPKLQLGQHDAWK